MQKEITISSSVIAKLYQSSDNEAKKFWKENYPQYDFEAKTAESVVFTVLDACDFIGRSVEETRPFPNPKNSFQEWINTTAELATVYEAFSGGKSFDWNDSAIYKYLAWYWMNKQNPSGSGLSLGGVVCDDSSTIVASRLHAHERKHIEIIAERFPALIKKYMLG